MRKILFGAAPLVAAILVAAFAGVASGETPGPDDVVVHVVYDTGDIYIVGFDDSEAIVVDFKVNGITVQRARLQPGSPTGAPTLAGVVPFVGRVLPAANHGLELTPDTTIEVWTSGGPTPLPVLPIQIDAVDASDDSVRGQTSPDGTYNLFVADAGSVRFFTGFAAAGDGSIDAGLPVDIGPDAVVTAVTPSTPHNSYERSNSWAAFPAIEAADYIPGLLGSPDVRVSVGLDQVLAFNFRPNAEVELIVRSSPAGDELLRRTKVQEGRNWVGWGASELGLDLTSGMHVYIGDGTSEIEFTLNATSLGTWTGGSFTEFITAAESVGATGISDFFITYIFGAPDFVNARFVEKYEAGFDPSVVEVQVSAGSGATLLFPLYEDTVELIVPDLAPPPPPRPVQLIASLSEDTIDGFFVAADSTVEVEVFDSPNGTLIARESKTAGSASVRFTRADLQLDLVPGMFVRLSDGVTTKELTLVQLSVDEIDYDAETVDGAAMPGQQVSIDIVHPGSASRERAIADGSGQWLLDVSGEINLTPFHVITAFIQDADGDWTTAKFVPPPTLEGAWNSGEVVATGFTPSAAVTLSVYESSGGALIDSGSVDADIGGMARWRQGSTILDEGSPFQRRRLEPGMELVATDGNSTKSLVIAPIRVTSVGIADDMVRGEGPAGATITLRNISMPAIVIDEGGEWLADLGALDINVFPGSSVTAILEDDDGDLSSFFAHTPSINGSLATGAVRVSQFLSGEPIEFELYDEPGGLLLASETQDPDPLWGGIFSRVDFGVDLVPGMFLRVTDGLNTKELVFHEVSVIGLDVISDVVDGTAPADARVFVDISDVTGDFGGRRLVEADGEGAWSLDVSSELELTPKHLATAWTEDEDGDSTSAAYYPAWLTWLSVTEGTVAPPFALGSDATEFTSSVAAGVEAVEVRTSFYPGSTATVDGIEVTSSGETVTLDLNVGQNVIPIVVERIDGTSTREYTLTVTRDAPEDPEPPPAPPPVAGPPPAAGPIEPWVREPMPGVTLTTWLGSGFEALNETLPTGATVWVTVDGVLVGYVVGAPEFVNRSFVDLYPGGLPQGTTMLVVLLED